MRQSKFVPTAIDKVPTAPSGAPAIVSVRVDPPSVSVEVKDSPLLEVDESVGVLEGRGLELPAGVTVVVDQRARHDAERWSIEDLDVLLEG